MVKTYLQEKLRGVPGQVVTFEEVTYTTNGTSNTTLEAVVKDLPVDPSKSILLVVNAPDTASRVVITNGTITIESDSAYIEYAPDNSEGLLTVDNNDFYTPETNVKSFYLPCLGKWVITATKGGLSTQTSIDISTVGRYEVTLAYTKAYIDAYYPLGSTCTCSNGIVTLTAPDDVGPFRFCVNSLGDWTVLAVNNSIPAQAVQTVNVSEAEEIVRVELEYTNNVLNNNSWAVIKSVISSGLASSYWSLGDSKQITLNGSIIDSNGDIIKTFSQYNINAFIIGFDHNTVIESNSRSTVSFQLGKVDVTNNQQTKSYLAGFLTNPDKSGFIINTTASNSGGWENSYMRKVLMPQFINTFPFELRPYLLTVNKYTDNSINSTHTAETVTATQDKLFLLSPYEVFGNANCSYDTVNSQDYNVDAVINTDEKTFQKRYSYYVTNTYNRYIRYIDNVITFDTPELPQLNSPPYYPENQDAMNPYIGKINSWWLRSPDIYHNINYSCISSFGELITPQVNISNPLISPVFVIGG